MSTTACRIAACLVAWTALGGTTLWAQRIEFPSMLSSDVGSAPGSPTYPAAAPQVVPYPAGSAPVGSYPPSATVYPAPGTVYGSPTQPYPAYPASPYPPARVVPAAPYAAPPGTAYAAPPVYAPSPMAGPGAPYSGPILPPPAWDPNAAPGPLTAPLFPQDYTFAPPPGMAMPEALRLLQDIRFDYLWMAGNSFSEFGYDQYELSASFALPITADRYHPFLITPGLTVYSLNNPGTGPGLLYDAFLDTAWTPQINPWLAADLAFRIGVYSDFDRVTSDAIRYTGHGLGVVALSPSVQLKFGVVYLDRIQIKLLPAGGVVWAPNPDVRFDFFFPSPKAAFCISDTGTLQWWLYLRGEYGGDDWATSGYWTGSGFTSFGNNNEQRVDYNDIRAALGLEFNSHGGVTGLAEVGVAFDRQIVIAPNNIIFDPKPTVFVHGGLAF